ncbi:hypothetical protein B0H17DRAFT_1126980 [Mycena rosella]|uniref:Uncharacterized protein n=1 Tax=Mycena rosella TaxID=1033263 RepID=A0AAD7GRX8_MYCRO|nr:hypothetical protein B0H17DRAFT_1126980 [Mycena rosella]
MGWCRHEVWPADIKSSPRNSASGGGQLVWLGLLVVVARGLRRLGPRQRGRWEWEWEENFMSETMPQISPQKSHPHSVDLLRNCNPRSPLGPFDGNVAAHAQIGAQHFFIMTNADYVPAVPSLEVPHAVYLRSDMCYGTDDPTLWPQQWTAHYCHLPLIAKKGARPKLDVMWWNPTPEDFRVGSAVTRGLGRLMRARFSRFLPPINELVPRCRELHRTSPAITLPLFGQLIQQILMYLEQLQTLPTTYTKMLFAVTLLQRAFLELDALYNYMTIYKERMNNYMAPTDTNTAVGEFVGAFISVPTPTFDLPDPDAHGEGAPPALYSVNSTLDKIAAIHRAARETPWYLDPFETSFARPPPPSPAPTADAVTPVASTSCAVALHAAPVASGSRSAGQSNHQQQPCYKPYPTKAPAKSPAKTPVAAKPPTKIERDKFIILQVIEMPPSIVCMADALAKVDHPVPPYTSDGADKRYVLPEPALLVNTSPDRHRKFLHHLNLLADGFIYMLTQPHPQLLSAQEWRDILEGHLTECSAASSRTHRRSSKLEDRIRPALQVSNVASIEGFPVPIERFPQFSLEQTREIVWQVAETSFRFEFCALDRRTSGKNRLDNVPGCFAGHMLVGAPLEMSKCGWAAATLEERHRHVGHTASLMLDWTTKCPRPEIIGRVAGRFNWSPSEM